MLGCNLYYRKVLKKDERGHKDNSIGLVTLRTRKHTLNKERDFQSSYKNKSDKTIKS